MRRRDRGNAFLATAIGGYLFARTRRARDAPGPRGDARPPERRRADERGTREALARSARAWETERAHVPVDLAAGTRDFRVALERGSPWTLGAAESAEAPNIEVRERCGRPRGTTSLSRGTASGCGVREDAPGKCRRNACSSLYKRKYPPRGVEVSKKAVATFFMTGAHTKRDVKKRKRQTVSFGGRATRATFPPASRERKKRRSRRWHEERRRGEKRADTRRAALTCEVSDVDVAAAEAVNVHALALIRASRLGTFPRLRASPPRPRPRARRDGILPVRGGERPERGGRERDVRGRHAQHPDAGGRAVRHRAEPPVGSYHGASASGPPPRASRRPARRESWFSFRTGATFFVFVLHERATTRRFSFIFARLSLRASLRASAFAFPDD